jgi:ribosomal protein S27E
MAKNLYKFPCSCGSEQPIEVSQAGSEIKCTQCGAVRVAPTMLKIKQLEKVVEDQTQRREETGVLRRGFFGFGLIVLVPSVIALIFFVNMYPHPREVSNKPVYFAYGNVMLYQNSTPIPQYEHVILWTSDEHIDMMSPFDLHRYFEVLKLGANFSYNFQMNYQELKYVYYTRIAVAALLVVLSLASIITSFFMPKRNVTIDGWLGSDWTRKK